jgi:hypothetical protein
MREYISVVLSHQIRDNLLLLVALGNQHNFPKLEFPQLQNGDDNNINLKELAVRTE